MHQKGFIVPLLIGVVAILVISGSIYIYKNKKTETAVQTQPVLKTDNSYWKTYTNTKQGYSFQYPEKLSLSVSDEMVNLSHSIPFENRDGGCDMKGDSELSKTLNDFGLSIEIISGEVNPPYVDGNYSKGILSGKWAYMGAEGCGQTKYYFPINGNKTLVITKNEVQILSPAVIPEARAKVLAVPGVISYEESKVILGQILSTFKFTEPTTKVKIVSFSECLPVGIELESVVTADFKGNKVTVKQKLTELHAKCINNKLVDATYKEIYFYHLTGCWGNPPENYQEILQKQQEEINKLKEKYTVIEMTCNPSGIPIP